MSLGPQGFHRIAYTEWGNQANPNIVLCVHGLTRNSRDFDTLAADLARDFRVVCMDVAGRGGSDWLVDKRDYGFSLYQCDAAALLARVTAPALLATDSRMRDRSRATEPQQVDWIGTSMGGLIGMMLASKANSPIRRLVMNDVGPFIPWSALLSLGAREAGERAFDATNTFSWKCANINPQKFVLKKAEVGARKCDRVFNHPPQFGSDLNFTAVLGACMKDSP